MRSETEWHCRKTDLKELQEGLCDLSEPKFSSVSKPSTNVSMGRKSSVSEEWPE